MDTEFRNVLREKGSFCITVARVSTVSNLFNGVGANSGYSLRKANSLTQPVVTEVPGDTITRFKILAVDRHGIDTPAGRQLQNLLGIGGMGVAGRKWERDRRL